MQYRKFSSVLQVFLAGTSPSACSPAHTPYKGHYRELNKAHLLRIPSTVVSAFFVLILPKANMLHIVHTNRKWT